MERRHKLRVNFKTFIYKNPNLNTILISNTNRRFEFVYLIFFRRILKYFFKKSRKKRTNFFCKICILKNYWLSKKAQNSRMGKGKGNFLRHCFLIKKNQPLLITKGFDSYILYKFKRIIEKKLNFKCSVITNFKQKTRQLSRRSCIKYF